MQTEKLLLELLIQLRDLDPNGVLCTYEGSGDRHKCAYGICSGIRYLHYARLPDDSISLAMVSNLLEDIMWHWPKKSGSEAYLVPVPGSYAFTDDYALSDSPEAIYYIAGREKTMWEGDYGQLRKELLDFCIEKLS